MAGSLRQRNESFSASLCSRSSSACGVPMTMMGSPRRGSESTTWKNTRLMRSSSGRLGWVREVAEWVIYHHELGVLAAYRGEDAGTADFAEPAMTLAELHVVEDNRLCLGLPVRPEARQRVSLNQPLQIANVLGSQVVLVAHHQPIDVLGTAPVSLSRPVPPEQLPEREGVVEDGGLQMQPWGHEGKAALAAARQLALDEPGHLDMEAPQCEVAIAPIRAQELLPLEAQREHGTQEVNEVVLRPDDDRQLLGCEPLRRPLWRRRARRSERRLLEDSRTRESN